MIASQLESATRRVLADVVVSEETIRSTGRNYAGTMSLKISIRGREKPLMSYGFDSAPELVRRKREDVAMAPAPTETAPGERAPEQEGTGGPA